MKVLLTGAGGQLGKCIIDRVPDTWKFVALTSSEFDITSKEQADEIFKKHNPDIIINAAAYTAVDKAENDEEITRMVNATAVKKLTKLCKNNEALFIHISTDYVFDGESAVSYVEDDPINPINIYGKTKAEGELAIGRSGCDYFIIRTSWVFSEYGQNFLKTMMTLAQDNQNINIISDQIGCPTYAGDIADCIISIINSKNTANNETLHFAGGQVTSWADYGKCIFDLALKAKKIPHAVEVTPITTDQYPAAAQRPKNSVLNCSKINSLYGVSPSDWKGALAKLMQSDKF